MKTLSKQTLKAFLLIAMVAVIFGLAACKKSKTGSFQLQLKAVYGTQNFAVSNSDTTIINIDPVGRYLDVETLQFYLSHLYLVKTDKSLLKLSDISFINFNDANTLTITLPNVEGDFTGINFYCGVDSLTDTISPLSRTIPPGLQAGASVMGWPMLHYLFEQVGGKWDTQDTVFLHKGYSYMVGGYTSFYVPVTLNSTFSVCCGSTTTKTLTLDFEKVFFNGNSEILSIATQGNTQSVDTVPGEIATAQLFSNNFAQAFSLK